MPKTKRLTPKEAKLVATRAKGKTVLEAATTAGYLPNATDETRRVEAHKTLQKPHVRDALEAALAKHNITLDRALSPIDKALHATIVDENGTEKDDIQTQLKGSDRALKLLGVNGQDNSGSFHLHLHQAKEKYDI